MKAVVMAGGKGNRLRPLTCCRPKPMIPIANRPVLEHILALLRRHGITEIVATLHHRASEIQSYFGNGAKFGVRLHYTVEETPLGTAGSVKRAEAILGPGDFLVISGDSLTDIDLDRFIAFHRDRQALATLALARVEQPLEYGVVVTEANGRITYFSEKPAGNEIRSKTVNTGIYCLNRRLLAEIEPGRPCDWSGQIFPRALARGEPLYGYLIPDYWCDVGSFRTYRQAQADALTGKVRVAIPGERRPDGVCIAPGARIDPAALLEGPALIGQGAEICAGARISGASVIGEYCRIGGHARITESILLPRAVVEPYAQISGAIIASDAAIGAEAALAEGVVIGDGVQVRRGACLAPWVKIWPERVIPAGATVRESMAEAAGGAACPPKGALDSARRRGIG